MVYSCVLFVVSFKLSKRVIENTTSTSPEIVGEEITQATSVNGTESKNQGLRTLVTLLFTLAVISVGVTGIIIPLNLINCSYGDGYGYYNDNYRWDTNTSLFSNDVQNWYESIQNRSIDNGANFAKLANGILMFTGENSTDLSVLHSYDGTTINTFQNFRDPSSFVVTDDNESICMAGYVDDEANIQSSSTIACSYDGTNLRYITNYNVSSHDFEDFYTADHLYPTYNHTIWFVASSSRYYNYGYRPVFSIDDETMALTLHSTLINEDGDKTTTISYSPCDWDRVIRYRSLVSIFSSIIPTILAAIIIMKKLDFVPTMPIVIYISVTAFIASFIFSIQPNFTKMDLVFKIWLPATSAIWMSQLILVFLLNRVSAEKPHKQAYYVWSINFLALLFFFSMTFAVGIPIPYYDNWWRWVLINLTVYIPFVFFGVVIERVLFVILGAIGIFEDAWKFSSIIANTIDDSYQVLIQVILFAMIGFLVGFFGWKINQYQDRIQASVRAWANRFFAPLVRRSTNNSDHDEREHNTNEEDSVHTAVSVL